MNLPQQGALAGPGEGLGGKVARRGSEAGLSCRHGWGGGDEPIVHTLLLCACAHPEQHGLGAQPVALSRAAGAAVPAGAWRRGAGLSWEQSPSAGEQLLLGSAGCGAPCSPRPARRAPALPSVGLGTAVGAWPVQAGAPCAPGAPCCSRRLAQLGAIGATGHRAPRPALPSRHPPPPSPSACFLLLLVRCPACCVLPAAAAPRHHGAAWLCLRPGARCLPVCVRAGPASPCRSPAVPNTALSAPRRQGEDVEAALVHPDRQLPLLLRVHHGQWPSCGVLSWGREGAAPGGRGASSTRCLCTGVLAAPSPSSWCTRRGWRCPACD